MLTYVIFDVETDAIVDKGGWTKEEAIKRATALANEHGKTYEVSMLHKVHTAKSDKFDFDI